MGLTLYVGADESGHGCKKYPEIVVATCSLYIPDGDLAHISCGRDFDAATEYLSTAGKGWAFTLNKEVGRESLTFEVPGLVGHWIRTNGLEEQISKIDAAFDGDLRSAEMAEFSRVLKREVGFLGEVKARSHAKRVKNGKKVEKFYDSQLVWAADTIASRYFADQRKGKGLRTYKQFVELEN